MFEFFTPAKLGQHRLFFSLGWTFVIFAVFFFMIGEFPWYQSVQFPSQEQSSCLAAAEKTPAGYGSSQMVNWFSQVSCGIPL